MKAIILAAGLGNRMKPLTEKMPKCLLTINGQTILSRLINQSISFGIADITVVVGYEKDKVVEESSRIGKSKVKIVENERYREDVNILSLTLALQKELKPFYLFEADCIFEDKCFEVMVDADYKDKSVWYSEGDFAEGQCGGIIRSNDANEVVDVRIVDAYKDKYKNYKKMVGALKVGNNELELYANYLFKACRANIKQYYHMPWIEHIGELKSYLCDLGHLKLASFNTIGDYYKAKEIFSNEARQD
jgi:choline kinase